jgi:hypothetical protein
VNTVVLDGGALGLAIPDGNRARGLRLEHDLADRVTDKLGDTAAGPCCRLAQRFELFLAEVYLSLFNPPDNMSIER